VRVLHFLPFKIMAYLFPNSPPPFFFAGIQTKKMVAYGFSIYPFGDGENGRMIGLVLVFFVFFPLWPSFRDI